MADNINLNIVYTKQTPPIASSVCNVYAEYITVSSGQRQREEDCGQQLKRGNINQRVGRVLKVYISLQSKILMYSLYFFNSLKKKSNLKKTLAFEIRKKKVLRRAIARKKECGFGVILLGGLRFDFT